jgi:hypothetical protein
MMTAPRKQQQTRESNAGNACVRSEIRGLKAR